MQFLVFLIFLVSSYPLLAIEVDQTISPSIRIGLSNASIQNASGDENRRKSYDFDYFQPVYLNAFTLVSLQYAPESKKRSQRLDIRQDMTNASLLIGFSYPLLFRLNFALGPSYVRSETTYEFDGDKNSFVSSNDGFVYRAFVDYAMSRDFEVTLSFQVLDRMEDKKIDRYYGISFGYNFPIGYKTQAAIF